MTYHGDLTERLPHEVQGSRGQPFSPGEELAAETVDEPASLLQSITLAAA
ncbi:hypothetical protein [Pseudomonas sp.]|nr:hypothetical protein [Pseudomonas sp.]